MTRRSQMRAAGGWLTRRAAELGDRAISGRRPLPAGVPPRRLRARVGAPEASEYLNGGRVAAEELDGALTPGRLADHRAILDFGCGSGRVLAHVGRLAPAAALSGVDVDAEAIGWATANLPGIRFAASTALPPLDQPDAAFDLIYSISVFSHLTVADQDLWLAELTRLLKPGGVALLSTHGLSAFEAFASGAVRTAWCDRDAFQRAAPAEGDLVTVPYRLSRWSAGDLPGVGEGYGLSFHTAGYIREHWGRWLEIESVLPRAVSGWQDLVVARRRH